jgi:lipoprotein NlpD
MPPAGIEERPGYHRVRKGDTLYAIAWRHHLDYRDLAQWNRIPDPDRIYAGQRLRLTPPPSPALGGAAQARSGQRSGQAPVAVRERGAARATASTVGYSREATRVSARDAVTWDWPTRGRLLRSFSMTEPGKKGVDIIGMRGQLVYAAAPGKVVYSGDGLLGYGPLVIIQHNDTFLSAYAYNEKLLVREGEQVALGQRIAEMGTNGTDRGMLHFEIRHRGRPVDPMLYLPARP